MNNSAKATLSVQWHITSKCRKHCRHCYMYESERYRTEIENELSFDNMCKILDDIANFEVKWGFNVKDFFITGGDPLLNPNYKKLLQELKKRNKHIYIMGNPETLTDENLDFLKDVGIQQFQMSLDGLNETHDYYRGTGSFDLTINALEMLEQHDIKGTIMFTLTGENKAEIIPLMNYVANHTRAKGFAFDLVCGVGNAKNITAQLTKQDVKMVFENYLTEKKKIRARGNSIRISEKSNFFQLLHYESNEFYPYDYEEFPSIGGCYVGYTCCTILSDGSMSACRRFPTIIGKLPEQHFEDIILSNNLLKKFRRANSFETCGKCFFYKSCRGCPAVTFGYTESPFSENPLCFKDLLSKKTKPVIWKSAPLDTTKAEEADLVKSQLSNQYAADYEDFIQSEDVLLIIGTLLNDEVERKMFFDNPDKYGIINGYKLDKRDMAYICYYIECVMQSRIPNPIKYSLHI